jgi:hypothetical protein
MTKVNTNFANLNSDKIETSYLDTDTSLTANSDVKIATQKAVRAYVDAGGLGTNITTATGTTLSLTTTASQRVVVWAKGDLTNSTGAATATITMAYNSVTKDTVKAKGSSIGGGSYFAPFSLMYTEIPGAGTHDITLATDSGSLENCVIIASITG